MQATTKNLVKTVLLCIFVSAVTAVITVGILENLAGLPNGVQGLNTEALPVYKLTPVAGSFYYFWASFSGLSLSSQNPAGVSPAAGGLYVFTENSDPTNVSLELVTVKKVGGFGPSIFLGTIDNSVLLYSDSGLYKFKPNFTDNTVYIRDSVSGNDMLKIAQVGANDYRLYVKQGGAWVQK